MDTLTLGAARNPAPPRMACEWPQTGSARRRREARQAFRRWLRHHRRLAAVMELPALLRRYRGRISVSAAYRAALAEGVRGKRRNNTRYETFWRAINWD